MTTPERPGCTLPVAVSDFGLGGHMLFFSQWCDDTGDGRRVVGVGVGGVALSGKV